jgi:hypothetical protein
VERKARRKEGILRTGVCVLSTLRLSSIASSPSPSPSPSPLITPFSLSPAHHLSGSKMWRAVWRHQTRTKSGTTLCSPSKYVQLVFCLLFPSYHLCLIGFAADGRTTEQTDFRCSQRPLQSTQTVGRNRCSMCRCFCLLSVATRMFCAESCVA